MPQGKPPDRKKLIAGADSIPPTRVSLRLFSLGGAQLCVVVEHRARACVRHTRPRSTPASSKEIERPSTLHHHLLEPHIFIQFTLKPNSASNHPSTTMTYTLYIGNKRYSSWSMRSWVLLKALDIPFHEQLRLFKPGARQPDFLSFSPSGKVPCLQVSSASDGGADISVWDSLAIAEFLAEHHPSIWPRDAPSRAFARCAASEMHSGFDAIRDQCSMNVGLRIDLGAPDAALQRDLDRMSALFRHGLERFGGPWLAGTEFTAADAFYAPVASRRKTFGLRFGDEAEEYLERLFGHPAVQAWVGQGLRETEREPLHEEDCIRGRKVLEDLCKT